MLNQGKRKTLSSMDIFDFGFAWNWQYDQDFVGILTQTCQNQGLRLLEINPGNLFSITSLLLAKQISFQAFLDRASDTDEGFYPLVSWSRKKAKAYINRFWLARRSWDKAAMHLAITQAGLSAPPILLLPPFCDQPDLPIPDLQLLEGCFAVKPNHGGGGKGVKTGFTTWDQVLEARREYPADEYLLQAQVIPAILEGHPAWFRIIYAFGKIFPNWWDPTTHIYVPIREAQSCTQPYSLSPLWEITACIAQICQLELFSTEIALTPDGRFQIVDYVNDPIDLRLQSSTYEGVPDFIVAAIAQELAAFVASRCLKEPVYAA